MAPFFLIAGFDTDDLNGVTHRFQLDSGYPPTKKLVVVGPYRYVRNPMITGVVTILLGESAFFGSVIIASWALFFLTMNHVYFTLSEEPGLVRRFGEDYKHYMQRVPRWIPRTTPWNEP